MKFYIARHAQVSPETVVQGVDCPYEDFNITPLGRRQASLLGLRLKQLGFNGPIYSSPFRRTLQTAGEVAAITQGQIILSWRLREISARAETFGQFKGMTARECGELVPYVAPGQSLPDPWWIVREETMEEVVARVRPFIDEALKAGRDALFIGHGASVSALNAILGEMSGYCFNSSAPGFNCSLSVYSIENGSVLPLERYDTSFIPLAERSQNVKMQMIRA